MIKCIHIVPSLRIILAYILGILAGYSPVLLSSVTLLSVWIEFVCFFIKKRASSLWPFRWLHGISILIIWFVIGNISAEHARKSTIIKIDKTVFDVLITSNAEKKGMYYKFNANLLGGNKGKVVIYVYRDSMSSQLKTGEAIHVNNFVFKSAGSLKYAGFDYGRWLKNKGFSGLLYVTSSDWHKVASPKILPLSVYAVKARKNLIKILKDKGMSGEALSVVSAMCLGRKKELNPVLKNDFSKLGISHILAVSGLHVGVLYLFLNNIFFFLGGTGICRRIKSIIILLLLWCYAFITGLSPSVMRSVVMFSFISFGRLAGKKIMIINIVIFSAFILLLINPFYIYDIGFQLSYISVLGIILIYPYVERLFSTKIKILSYFWKLISISIVAQVITVPVTGYYFHSFPVLFIPGNLVAVPFSSLIIYLFILCLIFCLFNTAFFVNLLNIASSLLSDIIKGMSLFPLSMTCDINIHLLQVFILYMAIVSFFMAFLRKRRKFVFVLFPMIIFFQVADIVYTIIA